MRSVGIGLVSFFACTALGLAAADFKIRYNQKFPCLEVMDSSAVKITDVTEGAKGETVSSGKSSLNISFIKNSSGQPEVTLRDAKSPLSEMEIEAFGLSVGMKPEGTVLVRFGADNKPKFEMDRTGGSRFLMADLGNLDTAAGKEVAGNTPSKNLIRCRERLAEWISGKGGWSNKSGKILATQGGDRVQVGELPEREIQVSEAFQTGAKITVGSKTGMMFQSGAGVFHFALPGTVFSLGKLEAGSPDLKVELSEGTIQTFVAQPLIAPRASLIALGNGEVARTLDGAYQISKTSGAESTTTITTISGKVILAQEAGGKELATLTGEKTWSAAKGGEAKALAGNSPEKASLVAFEGSARNIALIDIARDGVKACPEAVEEIVSSAVKAKPELAKEIAEQCLAANPKSFKAISQASGVKGLKLSKEEQAKVDALESLDRRLERLAIDGIDLEMKQGQVLLVEGDCNLDGKKEKILVGQVLALNDKIATGKSGRILVGMAPGVVLSVEPGSVATLEKMSAEIKNGELQGREAVVNSESGLVVMNIAPWNKEKTDVRVKTTDGESVAQGTVFAVSFAGGKMMTTVTRGSVGSRDSSGKMVSIAAGQQAAPGATPVAAPANSPAVAAAGKAVESTVSAMVANVAASIAAAIPTAAAEVAAIATKAAPAAAEQIAGAVAAKAPEAALAIAQAVSKVAPEAAAKVAAAVIAATPGLDAKSISAITTASSQGAADAPSVDTAAGSAAPVGAGSGGMGQSMAATQFQQLQAEQDNQAAQSELKAARDAEAAAKAALFAANERDYARALEAYNQAVAAREAAQAAANTAAAAKLAADQAAATAASAATSKATASENAANAADTADAAARAAAEAAAAADALAKGLAEAKTAAEAANTAIQNSSTQGQALTAANNAETAANGAFDQAKADQEAAAAQAVALQRAEAEAAARASAAAEAAQAAAQLQAALNAATTKAQQDAAAEAARAAADAARAAAVTAATAATNAANSAQTTSTSTFNALTTDNKNLANEYKASNPAVSEPGTASIRSMFTPTELNANPALKTFVEQWDSFIDKQREKFAALAEQAAKEAALLLAQQTEAAIKAAADLAAAKAVAQAALTAANAEKTAKENARIAAEQAAVAKSLEDARLKGEREAAELAKAAAAKLAADIAAAADLAASKLKATEAAAALEAQRVAEAAKVAAAEAEAVRLAGLETAAAAEATRLANEAAAAALLAATQAAEAAAKAAAAAAAAAVVPPVVTPPTNPNATPTGANA